MVHFWYIFGQKCTESAQLQHLQLYTFGTLLVHFWPKMHQKCTVIIFVIVHFWYTFGALLAKSAPKVHSNCALLVLFGGYCTLLVHFWTKVYQKCTKSVQLQRFWLCTFGAFLAKSVPKVYQKCTPTWVSHVPKVHKKVQLQGMLFLVSKIMLVSGYVWGQSCTCCDHELLQSWSIAAAMWLQRSSKKSW